MATLASPALPEDRQKQYLAPKSYADAAEELPAEPLAERNGNGNAKTNGTNGNVNNEKRETNGTTDIGGDGKSATHSSKVLKIVNPGAAPKTPTEETKEHVDEERQGKRPDIGERQESQHEYSATGLDDAPRTPPRKTHRRTQSKKSYENLSTAEKILGNTNGDTKEEKDEPSMNGTVFEKVEGQRNGSRLISIKPSAEYQEQLRIVRKERPLSSGKKAGQRWEQSAIRFAPLNVPLHRRLQTLLVLFHTLCIAMSISTFFFLCAIPLFWPLLIPYMIYCMWSNASTSGTLSHRSEFLRSLPVWSLFASYFPARLHRTAELPATRKYIFGYHPHGIISHGAFAAFGTEALGFSQLFPGIKNTLLTLDSNFRIPLYRDYALAMGLASVSKESCENLLSKGGPNKEGMGRAITIVVGGAAESLDAQPNTLRLILAKRKGFVKMAIRTGADLVPVLAFGENDIYDQFAVDRHPLIHKFQLLVKKLLGFTIPLFHARGVFNYDVGLMPYRRPINIVVGPPVKVVQSEKPSQEEVDRVHKEYVRELERLWELWKDDFAPMRKEEMKILE
ncbi:diacylglycerol acyltransferase-domain-containing protein [Bisporella sp. PMI_857]|nr:diacylglycerol acyltransferase-domain-containing protein [Bisporella sp. PMI_857]